MKLVLSASFADSAALEFSQVIRDFDAAMPAPPSR